MSEISDFASEVVDSEFGYLTGNDRNCQLTHVESWLLYNLGKLNNRIYTSYSGEDPQMLQEERAIYKNMFLSSYYNNESRKVLQNMSTDTIQWISITEGDSSIRQQNKNEVAKTYLSFAKAAQEELEKQITSYNMYQATPRQVATVNFYTGG